MRVFLRSITRCGRIRDGWSLVRDSYTNRNHCSSHEMWSYERDGRW